MPQFARLLLLLLLAILPAFSQTVGASLQGSITDPSGAIIPGAKIEIRNLETGVASSLISDSSGRFREPVLGPGDYEVRVQATGFQTAVHTHLRLAVGQDAVFDVTLQIGATAGEVTVTAAATRIDTVTGSLSGLVDDKQIRDLPLNGRSFQQLALLQPGVNAALAAGNDVVGGRSPKISINGARPE